MFASDGIPRYGQEWLLKMMEAFGYQLDWKGMCFGFSCLAAQAILANDIETFEKRLAFLKDIDLNSLPAFVSDYKKFTLDHIDTEIMDKETFTTITNDILPFFDSIKIYNDFCRTSTIKGVFRQEDIFTQVAAKAVQSVALEQKGGTASAGIISNQYTYNDLIRFFMGFHKSIHDINQPLDKSFSLFLDNKNHSMMIGYLADKGMWALYDSNKDTFRFFPTHEYNTLAYFVLSSLLYKQNLRHDDTVNIVANCVTIKSDVPSVQACLARCKAQPEWIELNASKGDQILNKDTLGNSLLMLAVKCGDLVKVKELLSISGVNPNLIESDITPLLLAIHFSDVAMVQTLLQAPGIDPNFKAQSNVLPIMHAIEKKNVEIISMLVNHPRIDLKTPIHLAVAQNKIDVLKKLDLCGIDVLRILNQYPFPANQPISEEMKVFLTALKQENDEQPNLTNTTQRTKRQLGTSARFYQPQNQTSYQNEKIEEKPSKSAKKTY